MKKVELTITDDGEVLVSFPITFSIADFNRVICSLKDSQMLMQKFNGRVVYSTKSIMNKIKYYLLGYLLIEEPNRGAVE